MLCYQSLLDFSIQIDSSGEKTAMESRHGTQDAAYIGRHAVIQFLFFFFLSRNRWPQCPTISPSFFSLSYPLPPSPHPRPSPWLQSEAFLWLPSSPSCIIFVVSLFLACLVRLMAHLFSSSPLTYPCVFFSSSMLHDKFLLLSFCLIVVRRMWTTVVWLWVAKL